MSNSQVRVARYRVRLAVLAALGAAGGGAGMSAIAAEAAAEEAEGAEQELAEVRVTGSRIVRRDLESNSPLVTISRQQIEDSTFISVEEVLNDLPQFMAGGVSNSAAAVTGLQAANGLDSGRGSGDMFNASLLPDNAGIIGIVVPGAANVNLRGLGANRSLVLVDGHRGMPSNASMTIDLNTIPTIAIGDIEVITGGASAVYGADALAGVTDIRFRDNFEGMRLSLRSGINEVGDGEEYQISGLMGAQLAGGRGNAMIGIEYSKREESLWRKRDFFREVMNSPYSASGDFLFGWDPFYSPGGGTGTFNQLQRAWNGNSPSQAAVNAVFSDRTCFNGATQLDCVATNPGAPIGAGALTGGFIFNEDGSLYVRGATLGTGAAAIHYGPQGYNGGTVPSRDDPSELTCTFATPGGTNPSGGVAGANTPFAGQSCIPAVNRVDYGRWLSNPREAYTLLGRATYDITDRVSAFANFNFASSNTQTRREPAPFSGGFGAIIPFHSGNAVYLPSLVANPQVAGQLITRSEFLAGGSRGTSCAPTGGCTMAQAFPLPGDVLNADGTVATAGDLRRLLESRAPAAAITTATSPFRGLTSCQQYSLAGGATTPGAQLNPTTGAYYLIQMDPNTGEPLNNCGPNAGWQLNTQLDWLPARGTENTSRLYQLAAGLRGDLGLSDWTWELYMSHGDSQTQTNYNGFTSYANYLKIITAPNYGQGFTELGVSSKSLTCTSGINPMDRDLVVSDDCISSILSRQIDRNAFQQRIYEANTQGRLFDLPAGEARASLGASYRRIDYQFTPDSLRVREYVNDTSAGQFASGNIDANVTAKEVYGELLIPLLKDLPGIRSFDLELGARNSRYSTGQETQTYKILGSWEPVAWARVRGGYNRAERAPNLSELYSTPSGSAQFASVPFDPCRTDVAAFFPGNTSNVAANPNRAQLQQLCSALINASGGVGASEFHQNPNTFTTAGGSALIIGNPDLKNEKGDTWTAGVAFASPFEHALLRRISGTVDWYEARVGNPIEVVSSATVVNSCLNVNGLNPTYSLDDPYGFCSAIRRDPSTGAQQLIFNSYDNLGKLVIRGLDFSLRWNASLVDLGMGSAPGSLAVDINGSYLIDQIQRYGADQTDDYAGYGGASQTRTSTGISYVWGAGHRVTLNWQYRQGTHTATTFATAASAATGNGSTSPNLTRNPLMAGYSPTNMFMLTAGTRLGKVNASISINNLLDTKPKPGGYDLRDPLEGFGSFSPFGDLVGRRYSINLSSEF